MEVIKKNILGFALLFGITLLLVYAGYRFFAFFGGATDTVKAASLTAIVTVTVFTVGKYFEQKRDAKIRINTEKTEIYRKFFEFYFDIFTHEKIHGKPKDSKEILTEMLEFQTSVILWGSDEVIKAYLDFKDELIKFPGIGQQLSKPDLSGHLANLFKAASRLLSSMRRDIGYRFTTFTAADLARLQMTVDDDSKILIEALRKK